MTFPTNDPKHDREIMRRIYCNDMRRIERDRRAGVIVMILCGLITICSILIIML